MQAMKKKASENAAAQQHQHQLLHQQAEQQHGKMLAELPPLQELQLQGLTSAAQPQPPQQKPAAAEQRQDADAATRMGQADPLQLRNQDAGFQHVQRRKAKRTASAGTARAATQAHSISAEPQQAAPSPATQPFCGTSPSASIVPALQHDEQGPAEPCHHEQQVNRHCASQACVCACCRRVLNAGSAGRGRGVHHLHGPPPQCCAHTLRPPGHLPLLCSEQDLQPSCTSMSCLPTECDVDDRGLHVRVAGTQRRKVESVHPQIAVQLDL